MLHRDEARGPAVDGEAEVRGDPARVARAVDAAGLLRLERRDLGQVEDVQGVEPIAGDVELAVAVDREVAEGVRLCRERGEERERHEADEDREPPHAEYLFATGAQRTEKCGFSASARRNQVRASSEWPRQRSIIPRWKNLSASWVPNRRASFEYASASLHRPLRARAQPSTSSPSIDGRSRWPMRARSSACASRMPWSTSNSAISRSVRTPFAFRS